MGVRRVGGVVSKYAKWGKMGSFHILFEGLLRFSLNIFIYLFVKRLCIIMQGYGAMVMVGGGP